MIPRQTDELIHRSVRAASSEQRKDRQRNRAYGTFLSISIQPGQGLGGIIAREQERPQGRKDRTMTDEKWSKAFSALLEGMSEAAKEKLYWIMLGVKMGETTRAEGENGPAA